MGRFSQRWLACSIVGFAIHTPLALAEVSPEAASQDGVQQELSQPAALSKVQGPKHVYAMPETEVIGRAAIHQVEHYVPDEVLLKALLPKSELSEPNMNETGHTLPFYGMRLFNFEGKPETLRSITIHLNGRTVIEKCASYDAGFSSAERSCKELYNGVYADPIKTKAANYLFNKLPYLLTIILVDSNGKKLVDCDARGINCVTGVYKPKITDRNAVITLPFLGKRMFNFGIKPDTEKSVTIYKTGRTVIKTCNPADVMLDQGERSCMVFFDGYFENSIKVNSDYYMFNNRAIHRVDADGNRVKPCTQHGMTCTTDFYTYRKGRNPAKPEKRSIIE